LIFSKLFTREWRGSTLNLVLRRSQSLWDELGRIRRARILRKELWRSYWMTCVVMLKNPKKTKNFSDKFLFVEKLVNFFVLRLIFIINDSEKYWSITIFDPSGSIFSSPISYLREEYVRCPKVVLRRTINGELGGIFWHFEKEATAFWEEELVRKTIRKYYCK
jgi:hypothetical protein